MIQPHFEAFKKMAKEALTTSNTQNSFEQGSKQERRESWEGARLWVHAKADSSA
jgi:hypothetical protein